jgi:hypothetical protein
MGLLVARGLLVQGQCTALCCIPAYLPNYLMTLIPAYTEISLLPALLFYLQRSLPQSARGWPPLVGQMLMQGTRCSSSLVRWQGSSSSSDLMLAR